jgi:hypothetical protein
MRISKPSSWFGADPQGHAMFIVDLVSLSSVLQERSGISNFRDYKLRSILHLSKFSHDFNWVCLSDRLLNLRILRVVSKVIICGKAEYQTYIDAHENVVFLANVSTAKKIRETPERTFSSPMVNFPWVSLLFIAKLSRFFIAAS